MSCNIQDNITYKDVTLTFKKKEIIYDIENIAYVEADLLKEVADEHRRHLIADICQDGNIDRVQRMLDLVYREVTEMLYPFTKTPVTDKSSYDNTQTEEVNYIITLNLPCTFSDTTVMLLKELIHEYFISRVLSDWFSIVFTERQIVWQAKAEDAKEKIKNKLTTRGKVMRRKLLPF